MVDLDTARRLHSGEYVARYVRKPLTRVERLAPLMDLQPHHLLADFACGDGMLAEVVKDRVAAYHGVDFSQDFIDAARLRAARAGLTRATFHCADIVEFCRANPCAYDVGSALDFSEHVDDSTFVEIFSAIRECLKPGGRLYLHTPNLGFFLERAKAAGILRQSPEHIAVRDLAQNIGLLRASGYDADKIEGRVLPHYNVLKLLHPLRSTPVLGPLFEARLFISART
jgi:2-polyprenyl-6-hydroxyphenyl methylase/3-demethylubiquinone-9 3-methyltransferase